MVSEFKIYSLGLVAYIVISLLASLLLPVSFFEAFGIFTMAGMIIATYNSWTKYRTIKNAHRD